MNRQELLAVGLGVALVLGVTGVANVTESVSITERPYESHGEASGHGGDGGADATIPVERAMRTAQNETGGTAVGVRLEQRGSASGSERPGPTYEVTVVNGTGSPTAVSVDAENGTVTGTRPAGSQGDGWRSLFGNRSADETPSGRPNLDALRSGVEAVRLARDDGANGTVTEVRLGSHDGTVVYNVRTVTTAGDRATVVVAASPDDGGVLSNASAETATKTATG